MLKMGQIWNSTDGSGNTLVVLKVDEDNFHGLVEWKDTNGQTLGVEQVNWAEIALNGKWQLRL